MFDSTGEFVLSVVVCTYNRSDILRSCLESLGAQSANPERFEVLVVDNNSTDGTFEMAVSFSGCHGNFRVIREPLQGLSNARNRGWREAQGRYVAYIDDDAIASVGWVAAICDFIARCSVAPLTPFTFLVLPAGFLPSMVLSIWEALSAP